MNRLTSAVALCLAAGAGFALAGCAIGNANRTATLTLPIHRTTAATTVGAASVRLAVDRIAAPALAATHATPFWSWLVVAVLGFALIAMVVAWSRRP